MATVIPTRMPQPEDNRTDSQVRQLCSALVFLSLDYSIPFYSCLLVPASHPQAFKQTIRDIMLATPEIETNTPYTSPELPAHIDRLLHQHFQPEQVKHFYWWLHNVFIEETGSFRAYAAWTSLLLMSKNWEKEWGQLELPASLSEAARQACMETFGKKNLNTQDEDPIQQELSVWDTQRFVLHQFYRDMAHPSTTISLMITQIRYRLFMGGLVEQLTLPELDHFYKTASKFYYQKGLPTYNEEEDNLLPEIATQLLPNWDNPTRIFKGDMSL